MIQVAQFTQRFIVELYKQVNDYGSVWVDEAGMIHRSLSAVLRRARRKEMQATVNHEDETTLRWIRVDKGSVHFPATVELLKKEFDRQEDIRRKERRAEKAEQAIAPLRTTTEQAEAELRRMAGISDEQIESEPVIQAQETGEQILETEVKAKPKGRPAKKKD